MGNTSVGVGVDLPSLNAQPTMGDILVSTGQAIAGIGATAIGALGMMQSGIPIPLVLTPIAKSPYR